MASNDALNNSLAGQTGTGNYVGSEGPTLGDTVNVGQDIQHAGDTDNKISFGADTQDFQTGGSSRMDISDSGLRLGGANTRVTTILDEDDLASDSPTALATQQSVKAYVDSQVGGSGWTYVTLGGDVTNATTTAAAITGLTFTPAAGIMYDVEFRILFQSTSTGNAVDFGVTWSSGLDDGAFTIIQPRLAATTDFDPNLTFTTAGTDVFNAESQGMPTANESYLYVGWGVVIAGGTPTGTMGFDFACEISSQTATARAGSFIRYRAYT